MFVHIVDFFLNEQNWWITVAPLLTQVLWKFKVYQITTLKLLLRVCVCLTGLCPPVVMLQTRRRKKVPGFRRSHTHSVAGPLYATSHWLAARTKNTITWLIAYMSTSEFTEMFHKYATLDLIISQRTESQHTIVWSRFCSINGLCKPVKCII